MKKNGKKLTKKSKLIIILTAVALVAVSSFTAYHFLKPDESAAIALTTVSKGDIDETLDISGKVNSENQGIFNIFDGVYVNKINVKIGDSVKKGDVLATFDTSTVSDVVSQKRQAYNSALKAYNEYVASSETASAELSGLTKQISTLENNIAVLENKVGNPKGEAPSNAQTDTLKDKFTQIFGDSTTAKNFIDRIFSSSNDFAKLFENLQNIADGINTQISSVTSILSVSDNEKELISSQLELAELKIRQGVLSLQTNDTLGSLYSSVLDSAKKDLDDTISAVNKLNRGWVAEHDGIIREINIVEGEKYATQKTDMSSFNSNNIDLTSMLSALSSDSKDYSAVIRQLFPGNPSGMVVEYYPLSATFTVSKNDIFKIALNQKVQVKAASGETFDGYVSYINPIATNNSSISINSLLGAQSSSGGIDCKVMIGHPSRSIIIGLDVELTIKLKSVKDVAVIPVESIQFSEDGACVFVYDGSTKRVKKVPVETGLFDGSQYQVLSGCEVGDKIVKAPTQKLQDGDKIYVKN